MKIRVTHELSDEVRKYIGQMMKDCPTAGDGLATRPACIGFLNQLIVAIHREQTDFTIKLNEARREVYFGRLTDKDIADANEAVEYLRAQGKSDAGIRQWLIKQRARGAIQNEKLNSSH